MTRRCLSMCVCVCVGVVSGVPVSAPSGPKTGHRVSPSKVDKIDTTGQLIKGGDNWFIEARE